MCSLFSRLPVTAAAVASLFVVLHADAAFAQENPIAPAVASTLDICLASANGHWRYSGIVSVLPSDPQTHIAVDYWIQSRTSGAGYTTVYKANQSPGHASTLRSGDVQLVPFMFEAPPLTAGTIRGAARVEIKDKSAELAAPPLYAQEQEVTVPVGTCALNGCVRTLGHWGNKAGVAWQGEWHREKVFYSSGMNSLQIYNSSPNGNAYMLLAKQFVTAALNREAGASAPQGVQDVMTAARDWFAGGATLGSCSGQETCGEQKIWAAVLDVYNNGFYPGGPPHCK